MHSLPDSCEKASRALVTLALTMACALPMRSQAPTTHLQGQVIDQTGAPNRGARIVLVGPDTLPVGEPRVTGKDGRFEIALPTRPGCYLIRVRAVGWSGTDRTIRLDHDGYFDAGAIRINQYPIPEEIRLLMDGCPHPLAGSGEPFSVEKVPASTHPIRVAAPPNR